MGPRPSEDAFLKGKRNKRKGKLKATCKATSCEAKILKWGKK